MKNTFFLSQRDIKGIINKKQTQVIRVANRPRINDYIFSHIGSELMIKEHYFIRDGIIKYDADENPTTEDKRFNAAEMPDTLVRLFLHIENVEIKLLSELTNDDAKRHCIDSKEKLIRRYKYLKYINENTKIIVFNFTYSLKN